MATLEVQALGRDALSAPQASVQAESTSSSSAEAVEFANVLAGDHGGD